MFTNTVFGFLQAYILLAVYRTGRDVGGYDAADAVTYVWLAQALIMTVYIFGWQELALRIRDGSIATDLSRPLDPQRYWLAYDLGRAPYHLLFRGVPPFLVGALVFELHYPTPLDLAAFVVSLALAVVVSLGFRFLYNSVRVLAARLPRRRDRSRSTVILFFSGMAIPLSFFPDWLRTRRTRAAVRRRSCRRRSTSGSASTTAAASSACSRCRLLWALALLGLGRLALRAGATASWWCRVVEPFVALAAARRRADPLAASVPRLVSRSTSSARS